MTYSAKLLGWTQETPLEGQPLLYTALVGPYYLKARTDGFWQVSAPGKQVQATQHLDGGLPAAQEAAFRAFRCLVQIDAAEPELSLLASVVPVKPGTGGRFVIKLSSVPLGEGESTVCGALRALATVCARGLDQKSKEGYKLVSHMLALLYE